MWYVYGNCRVKTQYKSLMRMPSKIDLSFALAFYALACLAHFTPRNFKIPSYVSRLILLINSVKMAEAQL